MAASPVSKIYFVLLCPFGSRLPINSPGSRPLLPLTQTQRRPRRRLSYTDRRDAAPGRQRPLCYLPLTGDTIPISIEFRLVASMVGPHIAHAHVVGLGTVSRARLLGVLDGAGVSVAVGADVGVLDGAGACEPGAGLAASACSSLCTRVDSTSICVVRVWICTKSATSMINAATTTATMRRRKRKRKNRFTDGLLNYRVLWAGCP